MIFDIHGKSQKMSFRIDKNEGKFHERKNPMNRQKMPLRMYKNECEFEQKSKCMRI